MDKDKDLFNFFNELLESNNYEIRKQIAINELTENYPNYIHSIDFDKGIVKIYTDDGFSIFDFEKDFEKTIKNECKILKNKIDKNVIEIIKNFKNDKGYLERIIQNLIFLINRTDIIYPNIGNIKSELNQLINYLIEKYSLKNSYKNFVHKKIDEFSFFEVKPNIKKSKLTELYDIAVNLEIIDDDVVYEEDFINVLCGNPIKTDNTIVFKSNNQVSVHFLNSISIFFNNLTPARISKSKSFYNKQGKLFNQNDIDVANNRLKKNTSSLIAKITNSINK